MWSGGSADGRVQSSVSELLQSEALCAKISPVSKHFLSVKVWLSQIEYLNRVASEQLKLPISLDTPPRDLSFEL